MQDDITQNPKQEFSKNQQGPDFNNPIGEKSREVEHYTAEKERRREDFKRLEVPQKKESPNAPIGAEALEVRKSAPPADVDVVKSEFLLQVEDVLAQGLEDIYSKMEPEIKVQFKNKGEEIARRIEQAMSQGKFYVKQILNWIKDWLKMIPGVNRFFLEQEAKIKADKILAMAAV